MREGVFILVLKTAVPFTIAILSALLLRLFSTASEAAVFAVFVCFNRGAWSLLVRKRPAAELQKGKETSDTY